MQVAKTKPDFEARAFADEDHGMICNWWVGHGWPVLPLSSLPTNGIIVEKNGVPLVCGFVYQTDSDLALIEWIVSDPKSSPVDRVRALDELIDSLSELAKAGGARLALTFVRNERLIERYQNRGFVVTEQHTTLVKEL
jgi:hypothetical protein